MIIKKRIIKIFVLSLLFLIIITACVISFLFWHAVYRNNVKLPKNDFTFLYVPTGSEYEDVIEIFDERDILKNLKTFKWLAEKKNYQNHVYPGRYKICAGMNNKKIIELLRSGEQTPVSLIFNNIRTSEQLAGKISRQIEADSASIIGLLKNEVYLEKYNLNTENVRVMFVPNTYEFFWNTNADMLFDRMNREYKKFWNDNRKKKAKDLNMTSVEVSILASIVDRETNMNDEKPRIAGVYLNRIRKRWKLQADPTLVYASGDFGLSRVLNVHKKIDSPYNTYKHRGLPPGPICLPSISSVDAVLNAEKHDYFFFVARPDQSGYHNFSKSLRQHNNFVSQYRKALKDKR